MKAIIIATLNEAVRKKTFLIMSIVVLLYLVLWTVLLYNYSRTADIHNINGNFRQAASIMVFQTGLQFSSMLIALLSIMLSAGIISTEIETGMIHGILSRPLKRWEYVMGKFLGLFTLIMIFGTIMVFSILIIGNIFGLEAVTALMPLQIIKGFLMYMLVPVALLCVTVYGSISLKTVPNGLFMIFIYIIGNIGGTVEMIGKYMANEGISSVGIFISLLSPFNTIFNASKNILMNQQSILNELASSAGGLSGQGQEPSVFMYMYIGIYMVMFLFLACRKFQKLDIS